MDKLGAASPFTVASLKDLSDIVVPSITPEPMRAALRAAGVQLQLAPG